jgi:hypothetical protein
MGTGIRQFMRATQASTRPRLPGRVLQRLSAKTPSSWSGRVIPDDDGMVGKPRMPRGNQGPVAITIG